MNKIKILGIMLLSLTSVFAGDYADGNITATGSDFENAISIADTADLIKLSQTSDDWSKFFIQTADITFADSTSQDWNGNGANDGDGIGTSGFSPIGNEANPFTGSYDGGGYEIDKLYINRTDVSDTLSGLFGYITSADEDSVVIKNLGIGENSVIINNQDENAVTSYVGGLIAYFKANLVIDRCYNRGRVSSSSNVSSLIGGLVGKSSDYSSIMITNSYNSGSVSSIATIESINGGLVGVSTDYSSIIITNSYNSGSVSSFSPVGVSISGGLVGGFYSAVITNSYNNGSVNSSYSSSFFINGGLIGFYFSGIITNSYNSGSVNPSVKESDGLVGDIDDAITITNSYFDYQTTGLSLDESVYSDETYTGNGISTADFKVKASYNKDNVSWFADTPDDDNPWILNDKGRPYLYWQTAALSNGIISDGAINISIVDVQTEDGISIVSTGLRYRLVDSIAFIQKEELDGSSILNDLTIDNVYYIQPYVLLSDGSYQYGDMIKYTATATSETITLVVVKIAQSITFDELSDKVFGDDDFEISAIASSGNAVTFTGTEGICSLDENTVTILGAGECAITASQVGNAIYKAAANVEQSFTISKAYQNITFEELNDKVYGDADFEISAIASSGNAVTFTSTEGICSVDENTVTILGAGECQITASQVGNENYEDAIDVIRTFTISKASQNITFDGLITEFDLVDGSTYTIITNSTQIVKYTSLTEEICTVSESEITFISTGTCKISANALENDNYLEAETSFEIEVTATTPILVTQKLNFTPHVVEVYTLKGELVKSEFCNSLSDYRQLIQGLVVDQHYVIK